ncbi:TBC1 domain family member 2A isoform X8 [Narcine bancroftii]|uniref:TBC1 domain family member 2A isoform X8 n=1 Tax=Narcine bancroftii TaxID=1343680 RepID=UPI0038315B9E
MCDCRIQRTMADELQVGHDSPLESLTLAENSAIQIESCNECEEPKETEDLANYLKSLGKGKTQCEKLCGYLNKLGGKGPLKGCKTRWFVYDPRKCFLYYFRTAHDSCPLGSMDLSSAAFRYCLEAEEGTFEIKTPEKEYILKAKNQEVMMYWLQQLQQKRWEHDDKQSHLFESYLSNSEQHSDSSPPFKMEEEETNDFLDRVKMPTGLVGEEAASLPAPLQPTTLYNISLKHLGTEIQNFGSKTVFQFYGSKPLRENRTICEETNQAASEISESPSLPKEADTSDKDCQQEVQKISSQMSSTDSLKNLVGLNTGPVPRERFAVKDRTSPDKDTSLRNDVLRLTRELSAQRDLVKLLHRALEAAQQEKRACGSYLTADDSTRLELVRHKVRQIRQLENRVSLLEKEKQGMEQSLKLQESQVEELKQHTQLLMEKNHAKQEVILKLSEQMASESTGKLEDNDEVTIATIHDLRENVSHMKDIQEAYKTQNKFLNSEIYQITKLWQNSRDREKALIMKCAYLEAKYSQIESKYLVLLHKLQDVSGQDETYQEIVKQFIANQLKWEIKDEASLSDGGLCRLAAIALLVLQEEEDAFWCLVAVVDCIMPEDYYSKTLTGSQVDQRVFKEILSEKMPKLVSHFEQYNVDLSYITFNWFLVVFVDSLLSDILLRVWDAFLYEGTKVIFRYALAIFRYNEEEILKLNDHLTIYDYLQCLTKNISEEKKLMNIAFNEMNPFPMRLLRNRRAAHLEKFRAELRELEKIQVEYVKERDEHKELLGVASEDEEET